MELLKDFWQYLPYNITPIAFNVGPIQVRWYSVMYLVSILVIFLLYLRYCKKNNLTLYLEKSSELFIYSFLGIIVGARIGYALFYEPLYFIASPLKLINPFQNGVFVGISGLSYHGGAIGFILGILLYCKKYQLNFFKVTNILSSYIPLGYTFGRIGNFLNQELYGKITTSAFGMYFPVDQQTQMRHPSQLTEAFLEGFLIFLLLLVLRKFFPATKKITTPLYCIFYSIARFFVEFIREPDSFQILFLNIFTYGQILSIIMLLVGISLIPLYINNYEKNT